MLYQSRLRKAFISHCMFGVIFFAGLSFARLIFQSQWPLSECQGPPSVMFLFQYPEGDDSVAESESSVPFMFSYMREFAETDIGYCIDVTIDVAGRDCCYVSLQPEITKDLACSYDYLIDEEISEFDIPVSAIGHSYCLLESAEAGALFGYQSLHILQDKCMDGITCSADGIQVAPNMDCDAATDVAAPINATFAQVIQHIGSVRVSSIKFTQGSTAPMYYSYYPDARLVVTFDTLAEISCFVFSILSLLGICYTSYVFMIKYVKQCKPTYLMYMVEQLLYFVSLIFRIGYMYIVFANRFDLALYSWFMWTTFGLTTLYSVLVTFEIISHILDPPRWMKICSTLTIISTHVGLSGSVYMYYEIIPDLYLEWQPFQTYWVMIMFIFGWIPLFITIYFIIIKDLIEHSWKIIYRELLLIFWNDRRIALLFAGNFVTIVVYFLFGYLLSYYIEVFVTGRIALAMSIIQWIMLTGNGVIKTFTFDHVKIIAEKRSAAHSDRINSMFKSNQSRSFIRDKSGSIAERSAKNVAHLSNEYEDVQIDEPLGETSSPDKSPRNISKSHSQRSAKNVTCASNEEDET